MKKIFLILGALLSATAIVSSAEIETRQVLRDGTVVINTTEIATDIKGYKDITPIKLYVKNGVIRKVELQPNKETPAIFKKVIDGRLVKRWVGLPVEEATTAKIDAISGATHSSKAIIATVQRAAQFEVERQQ